MDEPVAFAVNVTTAPLAKAVTGEDPPFKVEAKPAATVEVVSG